MFDRTDMQRLAVSTIGGLSLSAACVFGAVGPARAAAPVPQDLQAWQARVERHIDRAMVTPDGLDTGEQAQVTMALRFDAAGRFDDAAVARSSGNRAVDRAALTVARLIAYPALPADLRGAPRTVTMRLYYGKPGTAREEQAMRRDAAGLALLAHRDVPAVQDKHGALARS